MAILFGLGVAKYTEFNRRQTVVQAANELKANLRLTQDKALSAEKDCRATKCGGSDDLCGNEADEEALDGWYLAFTGSSYQIYGQCEGIIFPDSPKTVDLTSKGVLITPSVNPIHFYPLGLGGVEEAATINLSNGSTTQTVTVNKAGEIF